MTGYIEVSYGNVTIPHWISKNGYCYKRTVDNKVVRISSKEYQMAFETHYNI